MSQIIEHRLISFKTPDAEKQGFAALLGISSSIRSVSPTEYVITSEECDYLHARGIKYIIKKKF